jgi:myo-inositol catabolism protein IolS
MTVNALARFFDQEPGGLPLVFGCEQLGGHNWGHLDVAELELAVAGARDVGVRIFDTADCYGLGVSEERLGRVLRSVRGEVFIATKFGVRFDAAGRRFHDTSPKWCEEALQGSLRRLGTEYVDLFQIHYPDDSTPLAETFATLARLQEKGLIRSFGFCNLSPSAVPAHVRSQCTSFSNEFSLLHRENEGAAQELNCAGVWFMPYGVLGQGVLSGRYLGPAAFGKDDRRSAERYRHFHGAGLERALRIVEVLRACAGSLGTSLPQLAIAWVLSRFSLVVPIVGIKSRAQLRDVAGAMKIRVPAEMLARLDAAAVAG